MKYTFVDGNGNKYYINGTKFSYNPMTVEMSSSGTYSSGEPFTLELEKMDLIKIVDVFERALWSESDQTDTRTMGSGTLFKLIGEESQRVYLKMKSNAMDEINEVLSGIKLKL